MTRRHSPAEQYRQAKQIALDHNMVISEKKPPEGDTRYVVYRKTGSRPAFLGQAVGASALFRLVSKLS